MIITMIPGYTRVLGAPIEWDHKALPCDALAIREVKTEAGPFMVSHWKPTAAELAALLANGTIELWIQGTAHPVVSVAVDGVRED